MCNFALEVRFAYLRATLIGKVVIVIRLFDLKYGSIIEIVEKLDSISRLPEVGNSFGRAGFETRPGTRFLLHFAVFIDINFVTPRKRALGFRAVPVNFDADFSTLARMFPKILLRLLEVSSGKFGTYYNVNFPNLPEKQIKGIRFGKQGVQHWVKEFRPYDHRAFSDYVILPEAVGRIRIPEIEPDEKVYMMAGDMVSDPRNTPDCDNVLLEEGYIAISPLTIDSTDYEELEMLRKAF